ncbi:hypothetical protein [Frisingicoccus sp.]|uniref:hypothetical protein n=1 Tax=Frisingicoccus sp. TaxID=1918627 RepID=UPI003AB79203
MKGSAGLKECYFPNVELKSGIDIVLEAIQLEKGNCKEKYDPLHRTDFPAFIKSLEAAIRPPLFDET